MTEHGLAMLTRTLMGGGHDKALAGKDRVSEGAGLPVRTESPLEGRQTRRRGLRATTAERWPRLPGRPQALLSLSVLQQTASYPA